MKNSTQDLLVFLAKQAQWWTPTAFTCLWKSFFSSVSLKHSSSGHSSCAFKITFFSTFWKYHPSLSWPTGFWKDQLLVILRLDQLIFLLLRPNTQQETDLRKDGIFGFFISWGFGFCLWCVCVCACVFFLCFLSFSSSYLSLFCFYFLTYGKDVWPSRSREDRNLGQVTKPQGLAPSNPLPPAKPHC